MDGALSVGVRNEEKHFLHSKRGCCHWLWSWLFGALFSTDESGLGSSGATQNPIAIDKMDSIRARASSFSRHVAVDVRDNALEAANDAKDAARDMTLSLQQAAMDMQIRDRPNDAMEDEFAQLGAEYGLST
jgi:hypothetical protein